MTDALGFMKNHFKVILAVLSLIFFATFMTSCGDIPFLSEQAIDSIDGAIKMAGEVVSDVKQNGVDEYMNALTGEGESSSSSSGVTSSEPVSDSGADSEADSGDEVEPDDGEAR